MTIQPLSFTFCTQDPAFFSTEVVVNQDPYISHAFVKTPIYDQATGFQIGYKVSDDYVQQVSPRLYIVRLSNTYYLDGRGSITWQYTFENNSRSFFYPVDVPVVSTIVSGTGEFYGSAGTVRLFPTADGMRQVQITFH